MDFNKIYSFLKVAEIGSITRASTDLHLTQQAVSKQMLQLEEDLHLKLFHRRSNQIILTKDGEQLYKEALGSFAHIVDTVHEIQNKFEATEATIRIGCSFDYIRERLAGLISSFKQKYPKVRFKMVFREDYDIEELILKNELDMGLIIVYRDKKILHGIPLSHKQYILCASKEFLKKHGKPKKFKDLLALPFAEYTDIYASFSVWIKKNSINELKSFENRLPEVIVENDETIRRFILDGVGMGFISKEAFLEKREELVQLFPKTKPINSGLDIVTKKSEYESFIISEFKRHILANWTL